MSVEPPGKIDARWERLQELFSRAVELPVSEREAFVTRETADDAALRSEVLELLACDTTGSTGPLTHALGAALDITTRDRRKALIGRVIGNYKLVSVLGHGGTGTVYLGERADRQYSAQVAVKIVDSAIVHGDLGMRFRAERQILASLNHANIARLLDAGETEQGQPYLIMEYVHGESIDRYCDRSELDLDARLELFLEVCTAVQYAHQNLIVHRDLKPANILVTSEGAPKLLDFGIAKLLDAGDSAAVLALTRMNDRLLTPEYASPEQILGRAVTTASDVYALGVVLYELLSGMRPYTVPASASQLELERSICVTDPQRPSAAVRRAMESGPLEGRSEMGAIAAARGLTLERLHKRLAGDLDAIIMRALRKEPQHRYGSVEQLTADVRRYLAREPVQARQGNWLYYSQRFVHRHTFGVSAGAGFFLFTIAFAVTMSVQTQRIAAERDRAAQESQRAEAVSEFMLTVFSSAEPQTELGRSPITAKQLLDQAGNSVRSDLNQHPEVRARLLESIGRAYRRRGDNDEAISYLEDALHTRKQMKDGPGAATAAVMAELAVALRHKGDLDGSEKMLGDAQTMLVETGQVRSATYARLLANRGRVDILAGKLTSAKAYFEQSLALNREVLGPRHEEVANILLELSRLFLWTDEPVRAEQVARDARSILASANLPAEHPDRVLADARLAEALYLQRRYNEAGPLFERTLESQKLLYGENSRPVADVLDSLAGVRRAQGRLQEAEDLARESLRVLTVVAGEDHSVTAFYRTRLAAVLLSRGKHKDAEENLQSAIAVFQRTLPSDHQYVASAEHLLGEALLALRRPQDAEAAFIGAMNRWKRTSAPEWRWARSASGLGEALYRQGRAAEAEQFLVDGYRLIANNDGADREARITARERVTRFYLDRDQRAQLEALMLSADQDAARSSLNRPE